MPNNLLINMCKKTAHWNKCLSVESISCIMHGLLKHATATEVLLLLLDWPADIQNINELT